MEPGPALASTTSLGTNPPPGRSGGGGSSSKPRGVSFQAMLVTLIAVVAVWNIRSAHLLHSVTTADDLNLQKLQGFHLLAWNREQEKNQPEIMPQQTLENGLAKEKSDKNKESNTSTEAPPKTLALVYPPGLMGGYRNQVIRFIGLCHYAKQHNMTQLWQPSLLWSTQVQGIGTNIQWLPIPMEWIFDIDHWNQVAAIEGLPRIVNKLPVKSDCWQSGLFDNYNTSDWGTLARASLLESGSLVGVTNETFRMISNDPTFRARRIDVLPTVNHCQQPYAYGGGKMAGRLWNDMMKFREKNKPLPGQVDRHVLRALQPARKWQEVAHSCLSLSAPDQTYVALHARVELEMLSHACGVSMERNLTKIFDQVEALVQAKRQQDQSASNIAGLFVAVSRTGMAYSKEYNAKLRPIAEHNVHFFDQYVNGTKLADDLHVFECGERLLEDFYQQHPDVPDHGSLLQAVVNFHLAVNAEIFVGVRGSSYSTDVWTTRYYLGRGKENYRYTQEGNVQAIENDGLPDPHVNCGKANKNAKKNSAVVGAMMNKR